MRKVTSTGLMASPFVTGLAAIVFVCSPLNAHSPKFTDTFMQDQCKFSSTGKNPFFILQPGLELVLEGEEDGDNVQVTITVLDETKEITGVETRVVRERETRNGVLVEVSKNYFAVCKPTNSVFYFGEDVNIFEDGTVSHEGAWRAGVNGAKAGIIMPGTVLLGARYFQEVAPDVALDQAEIVRLDATVSTPFGNFINCLQTKETTPLEPGASGFKFYAPGLGLVKDGDVMLVRVSTPEGTFYPK
jgi:hypothetical protein